MSSMYDKLPSEIQTMIARLLLDPRTLAECVLVCKKWQIIFLKELYRNISLNNISCITKFVDTVASNLYLGSMVKDLTLFLESHYYTDLNQNSVIIIKLLAHLPNLERILDSNVGACSYRFILDALLLNQLPFLNYVQPPDIDAYDRDIHDYAACTIFLKDRLKNLYISDVVAENSNLMAPQIEDPDRFFRLYNILDKYKKLEELYLLRHTTDDKFDWIENVTRICPALTRLHIRATSGYDNSNPDNFINLGAISSGSITVSNNVTKFECYGSIFGDPQFVHYLIYKFPSLEEFKIVETSFPPCYAVKITFSKLLNYLSKIKRVNIRNISWKKEIHMDSIMSFCEVASQSSLTLSVEFNCCSASSISDDVLNLSVQNGLCRVSFYMTEAMMHVSLDIVKKYGHSIDRLILKIPEYNQLLPIIDHGIYNSTLLQSLKHCNKLKQVKMNGIILDISTNLSNATPFKQSLDLLRLENCTIKMQEGLKPLSSLFTSINRLELYDIRYTNPLIDSNSVFMAVAMTETAIGTLSVSDDPRYITEVHRDYVLSMKTSLQQQHCRYYLYNFHTMNNLVFKPVIEEEIYTKQHAREGFLIIDVSCKSVSAIKVIHGIQSVKLNII